MNNIEGMNKKKSSFVDIIQKVTVQRAPSEKFSTKVKHSVFLHLQILKKKTF